MARTYAYHEIRDVYNMLKDRGEVTTTLPEWSQEQNNLSGTRSFDAGLDSAFGTKPLTYGLRKIVEATGIPELTGWIGEKAGGLVGAPEMGQQVGESAGYGVSTLLPMLIPGLGQTATVLSMGGLGAANAYADTNSGLSALFAGATNALMPGIAHRVEQATLGKLGGTLVEGIGSSGGIRQFFPKSIPMGLATQGVSQLIAGGFGQGMRLGEALLKTDNPDDPSSTYTLDPTRIGLELTVGQLPFMGLYMTKQGASQLGGKTTRETIEALRADIRKTEAAQIIDMLNRRQAETPPIARLPKIEEEKSPVVQAQLDKLMARVLNQKDPVDERLAALMREADEVDSSIKDPASGIDVESLAKRQIELNDSLKGQEAEAVYSDYNDTFDVAGEVHYRNSDRSVTIRVADTPENRAAGLEPGKLITASVMRAPESVEGIKIGWDGFGTPVTVPLSKNKKYWSYVEDSRPDVTEQQRQRVSKPAAERPPELPAYTEEGFNRIKAEWDAERVETKARLAELEELKKELTDEISGMMMEVSPSPLKLSKVLTDLNEINVKMGLAPLTVKQLQEYNRLFQYDPNAKEPGHVVVVREIHNKVERATRQAKIREQQREFLTELKANADAYIFSLRGKDDSESKRLLSVYDQKQKEIAEDKTLTDAGRTALELGLNGSFIEWASKGGKGPFVVKRQRAGSSLGSEMPRDEEGNPLVEAIDPEATPDKAAESVVKNELRIRLQTAMDTIPDDMWVVEDGKPRLLDEFQEQIDKFAKKYVTLSKDNTQLIVKGSPADWHKEFPDFVLEYGLALKGGDVRRAKPQTQLENLLHKYNISLEWNTPLSGTPFKTGDSVLVRDPSRPDLTNVIISPRKQTYLHRVTGELPLGGKARSVAQQDIPEAGVKKGDKFVTAVEVAYKDDTGKVKVASIFDYLLVKSETQNTPELTELRNEVMADAQHAVEALKLTHGINEGDVRPAAPRVRAGGNFVWDFIPYDEATNKLGKHTLPKNGMLKVSQFKDMAGEPVLSDVVLKAGRFAVPKAFVGDEVNVPMLMAKLPKMVEVKEFGPEGKVSEAKAELNRMTHEWYDQLPGMARADMAHLISSPEKVDRNFIFENLAKAGVDVEKAKRYEQLWLQTTEEPTDTTPRAQWMSMSSAEHGVKNPHGYFEMAVAVPERQMSFDEFKQFMTERYANTPAMMDNLEGKYEAWKGTKKGYAVPLFTGQHAPFPPNTLIHLRGYFAEHPTEGRVLVLDEVQSDWGQQKRSQDAETKARKERGELIYAKDIEGHPLLPVAHVLGLKAVLAKIAKESPGTKVMIVGPETAMMTEGHDKAVRQFTERNLKWDGQQHFVLGDPENLKFATEDEAYNRMIELQKVPQEPSQSGGMTTAYANTYYVIRNAEGKTLKGKVFRTEKEAKEAATEGQTVAPQTGTLVSALRSLTGDEGREVVMPGVHKMAKGPDKGNLFNTEQEARDFVGPEGTVVKEGNMFRGFEKPAGSPVFRDPQGNPETRITGTVFDTTKSTENFNARGGFTLGNPRFAGPQIPPLKPANADQAKIMSDVGTTGRSLLEYTKTNPRLTGLARDLEQFGSLLDTVNVVWTEDKRTVYMSARERARSGTVILGKELFDYPDMQGTMLHELLHHFTLAEIDNPIKKAAVDGLEKLRVELIKSLPKDIKADFLEKLKTDWYGRYVRGEINEQMHPDPYWNSVLYGLIDQYEFVAEGGSSYQLQSFMRGVKRNAPPEGWFQKFKNFFKQLGGYTDSALDEFFSYTSRIVETNNAMVQFDKYFDSFFRNKGVLNEQALRGYRRHVYGLVRSLDGTKVLDVTMQNLQSPEVKQARKVLDANLKSPDNELKDLAPELGIRPDLKGVDDLFDMFVADDVPNRNLMFDLLPGATKNYLAQKAKEIENVASFIASLGAAEHKNITNVLGTKELVASANEALGQIKGFREAYERHVQGLEIAQTLNDAANPQSGLDRIFAAVKQGGKLVDDFELNRGMASKFFEQGAQLARRNPLFNEAWNKVLLVSNTVSRFVESATSYFHKDIVDGQVLGDSQQAYERSKEVLQTPKLVHGVERWTYEAQVAGNESGATTLIPETNPNVAKHLAGLAPEERAKVRDFMSKMLMSKNQSDIETLGLMRDEAVNYGVQLLLADGMPGRLDELSAVSAKALDALKTSQTDPAKTQQAIAELGQIVPQAALLRLLELHEKNANVLQANQDYMTFNSFFVSAQRGKKFKFEYYDTVSGTYVRSSADNKVEAAHIARGAKIRGWKPNDFSDIPERGPGDEVRLERINEFVRNQRETMVKLGLDAELLAAYDKMDVAAQAEREFLMSKDLNMAKPKNRGRTLSKGAEYLPWLDQFFGGIQRTANYWVKRNLQVQIDTMLKHPEYKNAPETTKDIKNLLKGFLQNDPESVRVAQRITTVWGLGFNIASYLANGTQTVMRLLPELINSTNSFVRSSINLAKTWADYRKHKGQGVPWRTAEENQFHREALQEGRIDLSQFDESAARQQMRGTDWMKLIRRGGPKAKSEAVATTFDKVAAASMWLFRQGERANATVSLISAFRTLKEIHPDWSYGQLKKEAYAIHAAANDVGGRANRPIGMFSGEGKFARGAAMLATTLQSYNIGSLSSLSRYGHQAFAGGSNAKTPAQRFAAGKALGTMLAVQFGAAGVLGLPFVTALTSLLDKFMPELEANKWLRERIAGLFGEDEEEGNKLTQAMLTGLPSMTGWDWQSRLTMGNPIPGVNEYNGFQPEALLGAPANLAGKIIGSGFKALRGDVGGAMLGVLPPAFKKLGELVSEDGMVKDYAGRPVLNDLSPLEKGGIILGFNPKRLSDFNALDRIARLNQDNRQAEKNVWIQELADMVVKGNFGYVRNELTKRMQSDPEFKAQDAIKSISSTAEALTFPRDLRREGTKTDAESRSLLLRNFGLVGQPSNEKTRILFRQKIEQQFGLISRDRSALVMAELMDQLLTANPTMTKAEARRIAEKRLRKAGVSPLNLQATPGVGLSQGQQ